MARRVLKKEDTVILSDAVQKMKLEEKSLDSLVADFVYRSSHIWSMRHPERAKECFHEDFEIDLVASKLHLKGLEPYVGVCFAIHDTFDGIHIDDKVTFRIEFTFSIHEIVFQGNLQDGQIVYRYTAKGNWVKEMGGVKGHGREIEIDGVIFMTMKNGKIRSMRSVVNNGADPEYVAAIVKQSEMELAKKAQAQ